VLSTESVGEAEVVESLFGLDEETGAIGDPLSCCFHIAKWFPDTSGDFRLTSFV